MKAKDLIGKYLVVDSFDINGCVSQIINAVRVPPNRELVIQAKILTGERKGLVYNYDLRCRMVKGRNATIALKDKHGREIETVYNDFTVAITQV